MKKPILSGRAVRLYQRMLPVIAAACLYLAVSIGRMEPYDAARLSMRTYAMLEHVMMSLTLTVGGGLLLDLAERYGS